MSTRSTISFENISIYCHSDGYPSYNGIILLENYNTPEKVRELLALGDISSLGKNAKPSPGKVHAFDNRQEGVTVAYHRDRKEPLRFSGGNEDYNYVFDGKNWTVNGTNLTIELCSKS